MFLSSEVITYSPAEVLLEPSSSAALQAALAKLPWRPGKAQTCKAFREAKKPPLCTAWEVLEVLHRKPWDLGKTKCGV